VAGIKPGTFKIINAHAKPAAWQPVTYWQLITWRREHSQQSDRVSSVTLHTTSNPLHLLAAYVAVPIRQLTALRLGQLENPLETVSFGAQ